jgi:hypothetical protein
MVVGCGAQEWDPIILTPWAGIAIDAVARQVRRGFGTAA